MKTQTIKINEKEVIVTKLALGKYAELLLAFEELPKHIDELTGLKQEEVIAKLPSLIAASINDFAKIIEISTNLSKDEILNSIGLDDATQIVLAIWEVNDYTAAWNNIKKILARPTEPTQIAGAPTKE